MEKNICDYGCGREGKFKLQNGRWSCEESFRKCPSFLEHLNNIRKKIQSESKTAINANLARKGKRRCKYCNEIAHFYINGGTFCCSRYAKQCPDYSKWVGERKRKYYKEHPDYLEFQRKNVKDINNDPEIVEKKRQAMLKLHNGTCGECLEFQENFHRAQKIRREGIGVLDDE